MDERDPPAPRLHGPFLFPHPETQTELVYFFLALMPPDWSKKIVTGGGAICGRQKVEYLQAKFTAARAALEAMDGADLSEVRYADIPQTHTHTCED